MSEELTVGNFTYRKDDADKWVELYTNRYGVAGRWSRCSLQVSDLLDYIDEAEGV